MLIFLDYEVACIFNELVTQCLPGLGHVRTLVWLIFHKPIKEKQRKKKVNTNQRMMVKKTYSSYTGKVTEHDNTVNYWKIDNQKPQMRSQPKERT